MELLVRSKVELVWVSGHMGSNEKPDMLARKGADDPVAVPEFSIAISKKYHRKDVLDWIWKTGDTK